MALSDNSGYCEACAVHKKVLRRLYDGITFFLICEPCFQARYSHVIFSPSSNGHRWVYIDQHDVQMKYSCVWAGCNVTSDTQWMMQEHFKCCKFASMITCTTCWQTIPVAHYDEHTDGSQGILMI